MIITVGNSKGGVGKSTIACNLAVVAAKKKKKVLIVDADTQGSSMAWRAMRKTNDIQAVTITTDRLHEDIDAMKGFDLIIIDAGGRITKTFRSALLACSILLIPAEPSQVDFWAVEDVMQLLRDARDRGINIKTHFVLNKVIPNTRIGKEAEELMKEYEKKDGVHGLKTILYSRIAYKETYGSGMGVIEDDDPKARAEIESLYNEIMKTGGKKK